MPLRNITVPGEEKEDPLNAPLTKTAHRNPDIHQRGDTLPESLLEYIEGSGTLNPDVAGNTPLMLRKEATLLGNGTTQMLTLTMTQLGPFSHVVTCPVQAGPTAHVALSWQATFAPTGAGGGTLNYAWTELQIGGVFISGSRSYGLIQNTLNQAVYTPIAKRIKIPINPGQTMNFQLMGRCLTATTPNYNWSIGLGVDEAAFMYELYY